MNYNRSNHNNVLLNRSNNYVNNSTPFVNNQMLTNNPIFNSSVRDPNFHNRMNMTRMEQMRKVTRAEDLGLSKEQLIDYVIAPIKVNRGCEAEILTNWKDKEGSFIGERDEYWKGRTNNPYKHILDRKNHEEAFKREIKSEKDLLIHKITSDDKDEDIFNAQLDEVLRMLETHDKELEVIYSASEKTKHKKAFKYTQKYKYRVKYDPQDFEELKDHYKKEQKKLNSQRVKIDSIIDSLLESEILDESDKNKLTTKLKKVETADRKARTSNDEIAKLENKLRKEMGDEYDKIVAKLEKSEKKKTLTNNTVKVLTHKTSQNESDTAIGKVDDSVKQKYANRDTTIQVSKKPTENTNKKPADDIGKVNDELKQKYLNRQK
jgi:hypothetical protein